MHVLSEITLPSREARYAQPPAWLRDSPTWAPIQQQTGSDQLYLHQSLALDQLARGHNLVVSTGTASGKSLIFQTVTLHDLARDPAATAIVIYPIKALARDQLPRWSNMAQAVGIPPEAINKVDGDLRQDQRAQTLTTTRVALMTPDIIQAWLMAYSNPPRGNSPPSIQATQHAVRNFLKNLHTLIIDEAHTYDGIQGTHSMYLFRRMLRKRQDLNPAAPPTRIIAASATIANPEEHLHNLTGQTFHVVGEDQNGAPRAELTLRHVAGRDPYDRGHEDLEEAINETINQDADARYIAFIDDRQLAERTAAGIEQARGITEEEIIRNADRSMSYRSGLMYRDQIEESLRQNNIRGITSTSAMEMGIDLPDLNHGFNLGLPHSTQRLRQRAGRIGRRTPGIFTIVAPEYALQYHQGSLEDCYNRPVERARLHPENPYIRNTHARCLTRESDPGTQQDIEQGATEDPDLKALTQPGAYNPQFTTGTPDRPHRTGIRDGTQADAVINQTTPDGTIHQMTRESTRREAAKEAYPLATYRHAKQTYTIDRWEETTDQGQAQTVIHAHQAPPRETRPIKESGATVYVFNPDTHQTGHVEYGNHDQVTAWEAITGCSVLDPATGQWQDLDYTEQGLDQIRSETKTTGTTIIIRDEWFTDPATRRAVADALKEAAAARLGIHPTDLRTAFQDITLHRDGRELPEEQAILIWERAGGGLGMTRAIAENLPDLTATLLEIAQDPTGRPDSDMPLEQTTATRLHRWATRTRTQTQTGPSPQPTRYRNTTFRSKLEAAWARWFDARGIDWTYEPGFQGGWSPDLRVFLDGRETMAEIKPVTGFPLEVRDKIDASRWKGQALILGNTPDHAWIRRDGAWTSHELTPQT